MNDVTSENIKPNFVSLDLSGFDPVYPDLDIGAAMAASQFGKIVKIRDYEKGSVIVSGMFIGKLLTGIGRGGLYQFFVDDPEEPVISVQSCATLDAVYNNGDMKQQKWYTIYSGGPVQIQKGPRAGQTRYEISIIEQ